MVRTLTNVLFDNTVTVLPILYCEEERLNHPDSIVLPLMEEVKIVGRSFYYYYYLHHHHHYYRL